MWVSHVRNESILWLYIQWFSTYLKTSWAALKCSNQIGWKRNRERWQEHFLRIIYTHESILHRACAVDAGSGRVQSKKNKKKKKKLKTSRGSSLPCNKCVMRKIKFCCLVNFYSFVGEGGWWLWESSESGPTGFCGPSFSLGS